MYLQPRDAPSTSPERQLPWPRSEHVGAKLEAPRLDEEQSRARSSPLLVWLYCAASINTLGEHLRALERNGDLTKPLDDIYESYVHLHCNRLLGAGPPDEQRVLGLLLRTREGLARAPARRESRV